MLPANLFLSLHFAFWYCPKTGFGSTTQGSQCYPLSCLKLYHPTECAVEPFADHYALWVVVGRVGPAVEPGDGRVVSCGAMYAQLKDPLPTSSPLSDCLQMPLQFVLDI